MCYKSLSPWTRKIQGVPPTIPPPDEAIILKESKPNQMTQRLEIWYMGSLYGHKLIPEISYQYSEYNFRFCGKN